MKFPAKILLFGEYSLVVGGSGLAIPLPSFEGELSYSDSESNLQRNSSQESLKNLYNYLKKSNFKFFDLETFQKDLNRGLWFKSNIPTGYGLGSSGALVAALYNSYCSDAITDLNAIKNRLSQIESYFHGSSSGVDPLVSYIGKPLLIRQNGVTVLEDSSLNTFGFSIYLVDTNIESKTKGLVNWFKESFMDLGFKENTQIHYIDVIASLLERITNKQSIDFDELMQISKYQGVFMRPMIPGSFYNHFQAGWESDAFLFKLCGSGGGGFMLCFSKDSNATEKYFSKTGLGFIRI